jgi:photosystem II stability/assembly factor-like uncharacterized protein
MKPRTRIGILYNGSMPVTVFLSIILNISTNIAFTQARWYNLGTNRASSRESDNYVRERAEFRFRQRVSEDGTIPSNALMRAKQAVDVMRARAKIKKPPSIEDAGIWNWEWLGPGNIGGRIRAILISPDNPNIMWIGSVSGGIWRTDNAGAWWYPVDDFMANLAVTSLVMDPTNHNILYAGTGEAAFLNADALPGAGIFKSIDGGVSWFQLPSTASWLNVARIAHHPIQSNTLLAAVDGTVRLTTNGGTTWLTRLNAPATDVKYYPGSSNLAIVGGNPGVWTSTDGGMNWTPQATGAPNKLPMNGGRSEVACAPTAFGTYYVSMDRNSGEIWRSTDFGSTWTLQNTGSNYLGQQGYYDNTIWVDPIDANTIVVGGIDLWRSRDGGIHLGKISKWECYPDCGGVIHSAHADQHIIVAHPNFNGSSNKIVYVGNDGGIQYTPDIYAAGNGGFGDGWGNLANNLGITQFYGGAAAHDGSIVIGGAQDNGQLHYYPQRGVNGWVLHKEMGDGGFCAVDDVNGRLYGEYVYLDIMRMDNIITGYLQKTSGLGDFCPTGPCRTALFIAPFSMDPNNPSILVAGGTSIWRTTSMADSWFRIRDPLGSPGPRCSAIDIQRGNSSTIWVGYEDGTVSRTTNAGATWVNVDNNGPMPLPNRYVTDIAINPFDGNEVFVTFGGYLSDDVWRTVDFGSSWSRRTGTGIDTLPALQVNTIRFHPVNPNWIYIGTDLGIFASENKGLTWSVTPRYGRNEGPVNVEVDELFWQGNEYLIAATHGRGMFRCRPLPVVFVDIANPNPFPDGSENNPYRRIGDAINAAGPGTTISIRTGDYPQGPLTFFKRGLVVVRNGAVVIH